VISTRESFTNNRKRNQKRTLRRQSRNAVALSTLNPQPESVPINALVPVEGTPMEETKPVEMGND
jgi:biotin synthase-like enzyme